MDCSITENYLKEKARMTKVNENCNCSILCVNCPLSQHNNHEEMVCHKLEIRNPGKAVAIVQKWSDEHPPKTYKDDFLEKFPNALKGHYGTPRCCRKNVYGGEKSDGCDSNDVECYKCWNEVMEATE